MAISVTADTCSTLHCCSDPTSGITQVAKLSLKTVTKLGLVKDRKARTVSKHSESELPK